MIEAGSVVGKFVGMLGDLDVAEDMTIFNWLDQKVFDEGYYSGASFEGYGCTFECVGRGDCGTVFRVSDGSRVVALKMSHVDVVLGYRLFLDDGDVLRTIHDRIEDATFIPRMYDCGSYYTVVEFVEGKTLADVLEGGAMDFDSFMDVYEGIENVLSILLRNGILAIDVIAHNIVMLADGTWKVVDVGAFEIYDDEEHVDSEYGEESWDIIQEQLDHILEKRRNA